MIVKTKDFFHVGGRLTLLDDGAGDLKAWAERHVTVDPNIRWLLGNFVEADRANQNGHIFPLEDLRPAVASIEHKALNVLHREQQVIGTFAGGQLVMPDGTELTAEDTVAEGDPFPIMQSLAAMWVRRFPEDFLAIRGAHAEGALYYSHETVPAEVSCPECDLRVPFAGMMDESYCDHMNASMIAPMRLHDPVFSGGAVIIPPARPGWNRAEMSKISAFLQEEPELAEQIHDAIASDLPDIDPRLWERLMGEVILAR